jgi:hypothetical protein
VRKRAAKLIPLPREIEDRSERLLHILKLRRTFRSERTRTSVIGLTTSTVISIVERV